MPVPLHASVSQKGIKTSRIHRLKSIIPSLILSSPIPSSHSPPLTSPSALLLGRSPSSHRQRCRHRPNRRAMSSKPARFVMLHRSSSGVGAQLASSPQDSALGMFTFLSHFSSFSLTGKLCASVVFGPSVSKLRAQLVLLFPPTRHGRTSRLSKLKSVKIFLAYSLHENRRWAISLYDWAICLNCEPDFSLISECPRSASPLDTKIPETYLGSICKLFFLDCQYVSYQLSCYSVL